MTDHSLPMLPLSERTIGAVVARAARAHGARPFVTCGGVTVGYAEADRRANRVANAFRGLGVGKGDRVGILCANRLEYLDLWFGLGRIGAVEVPVNTAFKAPQILHALIRADVPVVVVDSSLAAEFAPIAGRVKGCRHLVWLDGVIETSSGAADHAYEALIAAASEAAPEEIEVGGADIAAVMSTSGTTGPSKGVRLPHGQQYILARSMANALRLGSDDVYLNFFPMFHNTAQAMITLPVLLTGGRMVLTERFSVSAFWPDVRAHGVTTFYYIGEILHLLVKAGKGGESEGTRLRAGWGIGGSPPDVEAFQRRYGVELGTGFGSTEANVPIFRPLGSDPRSSSVGRVLPEFEVRIADSEDRPVPIGEVGEFVVRGFEPASVMDGYDGDPEASATAWRNGWFHSGDAGRADANGNYYFVCRLKDVIRVRGENVPAFEVEEAILAFPGVLEAAVVAVPCELGGDDVKAVVVPDGGGTIDFAALICHCERILPRFSVPRYVECRDALPKTETNKVRKNVLREVPFTPTTWDRVINTYVSTDVQTGAANR